MNRSHVLTPFKFYLIEKQSSVAPDYLQLKCRIVMRWTIVASCTVRNVNLPRMSWIHFEWETIWATENESENTMIFQFRNYSSGDESDEFVELCPMRSENRILCERQFVMYAVVLYIPLTPVKIYIRQAQWPNPIHTSAKVHSIPRPIATTTTIATNHVLRFGSHFKLNDFIQCCAVPFMHTPKRTQTTRLCERPRRTVLSTMRVIWINSKRRLTSMAEGQVQNAIWNCVLERAFVGMSPTTANRNIRYNEWNTIAD